MPLPVIFLDDGGVLNDNQVRGAQWRRLVGEYFPPRLGGAPEAWAEANGVVIHRILERDAWQARLQATPDYATFDRQYQLDWLHWMCAHIGLTPPPDDECVALAHAASAAIIRQVRSACPGAVEAIRTLHGRGYTLHTASGGSARELAGYLEGMGVRKCFDRLYGPDLINTHKVGPAFYTRLLADAGVAPEAAVVVDDNAEVLGWAAQAGARTVLVRAAPVAGAETLRRINRLADLPALLSLLAGD